MSSTIPTPPRTAATEMSGRRLSVVIGAVVVIGVAALTASAPRGARRAEDFTSTVVAGGLDTPWDMEWGPDSLIWISERPGRIQRLDPRTGVLTVAGVVPGVLESGEGGLMGIALHPDFEHQPFLFA